MNFVKFPSELYTLTVYVSIDVYMSVPLDVIVCVCVLSRVQYLGGRLSFSTVGSWDPTQTVRSEHLTNSSLKNLE